MIEPLSPTEERAWRALARLVVVLPRAMSDDLRRQRHLTLTEYSVLLHLSEAPGPGLRMTDLADLLLVSGPQTTRLVQDMERAGYVARTRSTDDGRSMFAMLTGAGQAALRAAWPTHLASTRQRVLDHIPADLLAPLAPLLEALVAASSRSAELELGGND